jgi:hypothetical protein
MGYFWHAPEPSHLPFVPQDEAPASLHVARGSAFPAATDVQVPRVFGSEQLRQAPLQSVSQQTPSTQWLLSQAASAVHGLPGMILPHDPFLQTCPISQSASTLQSTLQAPSAQRLGLQVATPGGLHVPRPSQTPGRLRRTGPAHVGAMHCVSTGYRAQPPKPSHVPVFPQVIAPLSVQRPRGSGLPSSTARHVPFVRGSAQERHPPSHATLQHT